MATCVSYLQGIVLRATKLDSCGAVVEGSCSTVVSEGFMSFEIEADETDGVEIAPVLANGKRCYYRKSNKLLNGISVNIEFCRVDPELFNLLTGSPIVVDDTTPTPVSIGLRTDSASYGLANVALELWMDVDGSDCSTASSRRWGYYLLPWLYQGTVGKPTVENGAVNFTVQGAMTRNGNQWGVGPYDIQLDNASAASPLFVALTSTTHDLLMPVNLAPPTASCGCQALVIPT